MTLVKTKLIFYDGTSSIVDVDMEDIYARSKVAATHHIIDLLTLGYFVCYNEDNDSIAINSDTIVSFMVLQEDIP